ncbi:PAS domain-containing protein [Yinghuangia seranimata]|uniref:PAS domain-containing protein n=1 Tax=Yinghuangia seranimata TaxID=408067 RepID=UPI00248B344C|nr:PAS domain-containing protein [Yinghuangia seranimata]MDI2124950.1 PAS domain-containing protein [Yinghuangia seranimata]
MPIPVLVVNSIGTVVDANTAAVRAFQGPGTRLLGLCVLDLLPEWDPRRVPPTADPPHGPGGGPAPERMTARRTDRREFPAEVTVGAVEHRGREGRLALPHVGPSLRSSSGTAFLVTVRDITDQLRLEAELRRERQQTELILRAAREGVIGVDGDGRIVLANPVTTRLLGYRAGELRGRELVPLAMHSGPDGNPLPAHASPLLDTLNSGRPHRTSAVLWNRDGSALPADVTTLPMRDGDRIVGAILTFTTRPLHDEPDRRLEDRVRPVAAYDGVPTRLPRIAAWRNYRHR